jgi:hypothetical protein
MRQILSLFVQINSSCHALFCMTAENEEKRQLKMKKKGLWVPNERSTIVAQQLCTEIEDARRPYKMECPHGNYHDSPTYQNLALQPSH